MGLTIRSLRLTGPVPVGFGTVNHTFTLLTNLSEIPTCCLFLQFLYFIDMLNML